jgi:hypothetical protein
MLWTVGGDGESRFTITSTEVVVMSREETSLTEGDVLSRVVNSLADISLGR